MEDIENIVSQLKDYLEPSRLPEMTNLQPDTLFLLEKVYSSVISNNATNYSLKVLQSILDIAWEDLNTGHWSTVSENHRKLHSLTSFLKVIALLQLEIQESNKTRESLKDAVRAADLGLILGCGFHKELSTAATLISAAICEVEPEVPQEYSKTSKSPLACKSQQHELAALEKKYPGLKAEKIKSLKCPSLEYFSLNHFYTQRPIKLTDCISHWPAFGKWNDINYLKRIAGPRTVPIEVGSSYIENDWGMRLTTFQEFIQNHITGKSEAIGYLAQHQLFNQVPELKKDICIPEYCCLSEFEEGDCEIDTNAWFGPAGTVTPLHYDPKHNLFCQVVGSKRILLYSPEDSDNLYPHDSTMLRNTAQIDPYKPNYKMFPKFIRAKAFECNLSPGEILYIPPKWWHHVRSLDVSFSVSFWWE